MLFTHAHADHILGIDDLRQVNRVTGRALEAIGTRTTLQKLDDRFDYAFIGATPPFFFRPALEPRRGGVRRTFRDCRDAGARCSARTTA